MMYETQHMQFSPMHCCASVAPDMHSMQATVAVVLPDVRAYHSVQQDTQDEDQSFTTIFGLL